MSSLINIKKLVVHILDKNMQTPVLSDRGQELNPEIVEFVEGHIEKLVSSPELKLANFTEEDNIIKDACEKIKIDQNSFVENTRTIAENLYSIILPQENIPSADLVICLFESDDVENIALLKFNYKDSFIHFVNSGENGVVNNIIKQKTTLPSANQKIDEAAIIDLQSEIVRVIEKKYNVNGENKNYFSELFLKCVTEISNKEKVKILKNTTEKFANKFCNASMEVLANMKSAISEDIEQNHEVNIEKVADTVFGQNTEMKGVYMDFVDKAGIKEKSVKINHEIGQKAFNKQKIKTELGVEITLPVQYLKENVQFLNNPDGTVSIIIKNVGNVIK